MKIKNKEHVSFQGNLYEDLFIPKKTPYEDLFTGGVLEELSNNNLCSLMHQNSNEVKNLLQNTNYKKGDKLTRKDKINHLNNR